METVGVRAAIAARSVPIDGTIARMGQIARSILAFVHLRNLALGRIGHPDGDWRTVVQWHLDHILLRLTFSKIITLVYPICLIKQTI